jgi:hypothetical protein
MDCFASLAMTITPPAGALPPSGALSSQDVGSSRAAPGISPPPAVPLPFTLCFSASIRLMTLLSFVPFQWARGAIAISSIYNALEPQRMLRVLVPSAYRHVLGSQASYQRD